MPGARKVCVGFWDCQWANKDLARFFVGLGYRFETCQWIDGKPTADDSCKCGLPVRHGASYYDQHEDEARLHPRTEPLKIEDRQAA